MHSRKRSSAYISDDTSTGPNDQLLTSNLSQNAIAEHDTPSKRLQNPHGAPIPQPQPLNLRFNTPRLLNNLAFTRLYVTANFHAWDPSSSPVLFCCVRSQEAEIYRGVWCASSLPPSLSRDQTRPDWSGD